MGSFSGDQKQRNGFKFLRLALRGCKRGKKRLTIFVLEKGEKKGERKQEREMFPVCLRAHKGARKVEKKEL